MRNRRLGRMGGADLEPQAFLTAASIALIGLHAAFSPTEGARASTRLEVFVEPGPNQRLRGDYPQIQKAIEDLHTAFARSSFTVIENNSIGAAVGDNLDIPVHQLRRFTTSTASKERIIEALRLQLQLQLLKFQPSLKQLATELRDYQLPDTHCVQDSVMALAIALEHAPEAQGFESTGRINRSLFRALNRPASSRQPISTGSITWTPAN